LGFVFKFPVSVDSFRIPRERPANFEAMDAASNAEPEHSSGEDAKSNVKPKETRAEMLSRHQYVFLTQFVAIVVH